MYSTRQKKLNRSNGTCKVSNALVSLKLHPSNVQVTSKLHFSNRKSRTSHFKISSRDARRRRQQLRVVALYLAMSTQSLAQYLYSTLFPLRRARATGVHGHAPTGVSFSLSHGRRDLPTCALREKAWLRKATQRASGALRLYSADRNARLA